MYTKTIVKCDILKTLTTQLFQGLIVLKIFLNTTVYKWLRDNISNNIMIYCNFQKTNHKVIIWLFLTSCQNILTLRNLCMVQIHERVTLFFGVIYYLFIYLKTTTRKRHYRILSNQCHTIIISKLINVTLKVHFV